MIWRRVLLVAVLAVTGLAFETSVLGGATLNGTKPELLLLVTVALAMTDGPGLGMTAGFVLGLATDLVVGLPQGISALTFTLVGYAVGRIRAQMQAPSAWVPMVMVAVATFLGVLFYGGFSLLLGQESLQPLRILRHAGQAAGYNALLTPFAYPVVRALGSRLRPRATGVMR